MTEQLTCSAYDVADALLDWPSKDPKDRAGLAGDLRRLLEAAQKIQIEKRDAFVASNRLSVAARFEVSNSIARHVEAERAAIYQAEFGDDEGGLRCALARNDLAEKECQAAHELAAPLIERANDAQSELKGTTSDVEYIEFLISALALL